MPDAMVGSTLMRVPHRCVLAVLALLVTGCGASNAAADGAQVDASIEDPLVDALAGKRVLWIGAHPDDEGTVAPLLGEVCVDRKATCTFLVATRGETGSCGLGSCAPDVGTFRSGEMVTAATLFGGTVVQWRLADGSSPDPNTVVSNWAASQGGVPALVANMQAAIAAASPEAVITLDPRHGTTCHPDHRAIAMVAISALGQMGSSAPKAYLAETKYQEATDPSALGYVPAVSGDTNVIGYDARRTRAAGGPTWDYLLDDLHAHASQFNAGLVAEFAAAPASEQRVFVLPFADASADPRYDSLCP